MSEPEELAQYRLRPNALHLFALEESDDKDDSASWRPVKVQSTKRYLRAVLCGGAFKGAIHDMHSSFDLSPKDKR